MSSTHPYTCLACALAFQTSQIQRTHYASDLHKYNAKRKTAGLQPVTEAQFQLKVNQQVSLEAAADKPDRSHCRPCRKSFASEKAYEAHLSSKKHIQATLDGIEVPKPAASQEAYEDSSDRPCPCLFCPTALQTDDARLAHMHRQHGFFLPDTDYLVDRAGLLARLSGLVAAFHVCLACGLSFRQDDPEASAPQTPQARRKGILAVQMHMRDKNHCKLPWDTEADRLEWSDFYDYSASYSRTAAEEDEWEDVDDADGADADAEAVSDSDEDLDEAHVRLGDTIFELVLPTGRRIGHRALKGMYKQNFVPVLERERFEREARANLPAAQQARLRAGTGGSSALAVRSNDGQLLLASNPGQAKRANRPQGWAEKAARHRFQTRVGFRHNSQKHFRDPLLQ